MALPGPQVIQSATGNTTAITDTSVAATWGSNVSNGNLIVVCVNGGVNTVSSISDTQGNSYVVADAGNNTWSDCEIWYAKNVKGGGGTVTANFSGGMPGTIHIYEVSGADISYPLDVTKNAAGDGVTPNTPTATTSATTTLNQIVFATGSVYLGAGTDDFTVGSGYTSFTAENSEPTVGITVSSGAEKKNVEIIGTQTATFGLAFGSTTWQLTMATFKSFTQGTTTSTSSTSISSTSSSISSTSISTSSTSLSTSSTSRSTSTSSTSISISITTVSTSSTSSSISSTSSSSTSSSTSISSTSTSLSSTSQSSTSVSSTSSSTSISSTSSSISSTSSSISSTSVSTSSTSFSSTSSSSSTSTTTLPPPYLDYTYEDRASFTTVLDFIQTGTWVCPANVTSLQIECWGGGGGGGSSGAGAGGGGGGGGGAYSKETALSVTPATSYTVTVGTGGASVTDGGDTWFSTTGTVLAKGGAKGGAGAGGAGGSAGAGGAAGSGVGDIKKSGGTGGAGGVGGTGGGGGGGAGDVNDGQTGTAGASGGAGGIMGATTGGVGGAGSGGGTAGLPGKAISGGGGGAGSGGINGGAGASGMVRLTYTTTTPPPSDATDLINRNTVPLYTYEAADDADYSIQFGSKYVISNFQRKHINNTDTPVFTWKGRTTVSTLTNPLLIQIYNTNSSAWETLAVINKLPADTDTSITVSQASNQSNYYSADNTVTFRSYQQVN